MSQDLEEEASVHRLGAQGAGGDVHILRMELGMGVFGESQT